MTARQRRESGWFYTDPQRRGPPAGKLSDLAAGASDIIRPPASGSCCRIREVRVPVNRLPHCPIKHHTTSNTIEEECGGGLLLIIEVEP